MRKGVHLPAALATMLVWAVIQPPRQAHAQASSLQGTYDLDGGASQDIGKAIDKVAGQMSFLAAPVARKRLMATNPPVRRITISYTDKDVTIQADGGAALRTPADGTPIDWTREGGEKVKVSTIWEGAQLKRSLASRDGVRVNTYRLDATGNTLTLDVMVTGAQLPQALIYRLLYRRKN
jgi:hypothetical protein